MCGEGVRGHVAGYMYMYIDVHVVVLLLLPLNFLHTSCSVELCNFSDTFIVGPTVQYRP